MSGVLNLYAFVSNDPIRRADILGLLEAKFGPQKISDGAVETTVSKTVFEQNISFECKKCAGFLGFFQTFDLRFKLEITIETILEPATSPEWSSSQPFYDQAVNTVWNNSSDYNARRAAILAHEGLHIGDLEVYFNQAKEKLLKAEGAYNSKAECVAAGNKLPPELNKIFKDTGTASQNNRD